MDSKKRKREPWERSKGWKSVEVGDGLLLGSAEGGFCGLEVLSPEDIGGNGQQPEGDETVSARKQGKVKAKQDKQRTSEKKQPTAAVEDLQKKLAAAEAEAQRLRQLVEKAPSKKAKLTLKSEEEEPEKDAPEESAKAVNHKERKRLQRAAYKTAKRDLLKNQKAELRKQKKREQQIEQKTQSAVSAIASELTEEGASGLLDMSAWRPYELDARIEKALSDMGFTSPTPIQQECLPSAIRDRRDVIGAAQTGSGKTLAFGLPIVQALLEERGLSIGGTEEDPAVAEDKLERRKHKHRLRALILAPTRELAIQVSEHLQAVAKPCGIWVAPIVGGIAVEKQERYLRGQPEIVVATPGRLWELMRDGAEHLTDMQDLSFLVLDEADRMVQQGHYEELSSILEFVPQRKGHPVKRADEESSGEEEEEEEEEEDDDLTASRKKRRLQTFVFSATLTLPEGLRRRLKRGGGGSSGSVTLENLMEKISFGHKPKIADLTSKRRVADKVTEAYLECTEDNRDERLYYLLTQHPGRTLIFTNAISMVRRLAAVLKLLQLPVAAMHSSMQQRQRLKALDRFRKSDSAIMIATDVAARGLDIPEVACVIHYQLPAAADVYVHRCGRTARASAEGISVALVTPKEQPRFSALCKAMHQEDLPLFPLDHKLMPGARKRVQVALKLDELMRSSSKKSAEKTWEQQMAEAAGIILSDAEEDDEEPINASQNDKAASAKALQQELAALLQEPLQPKYSQRYFTGQPSAALAPNAAANDPKEATDLNPQAINQAVAHAQRLAEARTAGTAAVAAKQRKKGKKKDRVHEPEARRKKAVANAVKSQAKAQKAKGGAGKSALGRSRFVVIPGALAREVKGAKALDALRSKLTPGHHVP